MSLKKIEELLDNAEKKVHAGEWIRIQVVRTLLWELALWMNVEFHKTLDELRPNIEGDEEE